MLNVVFGDNHLFGINHLSLEKAEAYKKQFSKGNALRDSFVMLKNNGVTEQMMSAHQTAKQVCEIALEAHPEIIIHPVIPYAHAINDEAAANGVVKTAIKLLKPSIADTIKTVFDFLHPGRSVEVPKSSVRRFVLAQLEHFGNLPHKNKGVLFINNVFCDLLIGMGVVEWFYHFRDICAELGYKPGVITYNPNFFVKHPMPWLEICVHHNHKNFLNNLEDDALKSLCNQQKVWAMGIFGSGAYQQEDVMKDLADNNFASVVFASSKEHRLVSFLEQLKQI
jgi:hypothetical protein